MNAASNLYKRSYLSSVLAIVMLFGSMSAAAQERILLFHSDIEIAADASITVTETIRVRAEGDLIRRGLYREFPTRYRDRAGNAYRVEFEVQQLFRDGQPEPWSAEASRNGVRVDFGDDRVLQVPREYEYQLQYRTNRQIGFFDTHDELYWNVTGNGWGFVIEQASARVYLPAQINPDLLSIEGYTGAFGEAGQDYWVSSTHSEAGITTTLPLLPAQGLTLVLSFPKGIVSEPDATQRVDWFFADNLAALLALLTLLMSMIYLFLCWLRVGRDPPRGVIFPHYEPPSGFSPAASRYIMRLHYDNKALTAAIVNLAVKGGLQISQQGDKYTLTKHQAGQDLSSGEAALYAQLFRKSNVLELENENHAVLSKAKSAHARALSKEFKGPYFVRNSWYLMPSMVVTLLMLLVTVSVTTFTPLSVLIFGSLIPLHLLFAWLLHQPTALGRAMMDKLEGFKLFLEVAEKDDLDIKHPPELTPALFEQYLPYAIALGVELAWGKKFARVFADIKGQDGVDYRPRWYAGSFDAARLRAFTKTIGSGFDSAISSAATAPGSSSGAGGGGFSGGGGGGGGGGGR